MHMAINRQNQILIQHSLIKSLILHILPGLVVTIAFVLFKSVLDSSGYPPLFAFLLVMLLIDLPMLLGIMLVEGKKLNGRFSLNGVVLYREKVSWGTFALIFISSFIALLILITLVTPINNFLAERLFFGLPKWVFLDEQSQYMPFPKSVLIITMALQLVMTGVVMPWVEELYFRGFLLPRMSRYGVWTPLIGGLFFGLYHSWQLYGFFTIFLLGSALGFVVWWKQDIRLTISMHVFANSLSRLGFLIMAISM